MIADARKLDWPRLAVFLAVAILLASVVGYEYYRALDSPFVIDDRISILGNPSIRQLLPLSVPLSAPHDYPTAGRPLVNLSFAINYHFDEFNTRWYHIVNMILHAFSAMLLYGILRRTLRLPFFASRFDSAATPLALAVALLWAVHPLQTESVVYVTQRTELMVGFFYLTTLYASLRYWLTESNGARYAWLSLAILAALGGMASKEVMVSAPLVVLLFDRVFHSGSFRKAVQSSWPLYVGLAATWGLLLALNLHGPRSSSAGFHHTVSPVAWWLTQCKIFWLYLKLTFWPWPLAIHYHIPYLTTLAQAWPWVLATVAIAGMSLFLFARRYAAGFVAAWVVAILAPTLIVPITTEVAAERRMYLPLAAIVALVVTCVYSLGNLARSSITRRVWRIGALAAAFGVATGCFFISRERLAAYDSQVALWTDVLVHQPDSYIALDCLGAGLVAENRAEEAIEPLEHAIALKPDYDLANYNLGAAMMKLGRGTEAIAQFEKTLEIAPDFAIAHWNLGALLYKSGNTSGGIEHLEQAIRFKPSNPNWHYDLATILLEAGIESEALGHYQRAAELAPDQAEPHLGVAALLERSGQHAEAIPHYRRAVELMPNDSETRFTFANALVVNGETEEALVQLREAARLAAARPRKDDDMTDHRSHEVEVWISLAECYEHLGRGTEAVDAAEQALTRARHGDDRESIDRCERLLTNCRARFERPDDSAGPTRPESGE